MRRQLVAAIAAVTAAAAPVTAGAATLCVGPGPGCRATLQAAVDAAQNGDTIRIAPGSYAGGITIDRSVKVVGAGAGATVIRGGGPVVTVLNVGGTSVTMQGLTITGGVNTAWPEPFFARGGGVDVAPTEDGGLGATVTIRDAVIAGNRAAPRAIFPSPSGVICEDGGFCPYAQGDGGGIANSGTLTLENVVVSGNTAGSALASDADGGGIINEFGATLVVRRSRVVSNEARATAPNGRFAEGGGIFTRRDTTFTLDRSSVSGNKALLLTSMSNVVTSGTLSQAGGIRVGPDADATVHDSVVSDNEVVETNERGDAVAFSGGLHVDGNVDLLRTIVSGNRVTASVPAGSTATAVADSGAGEINTNATIRASRFSGNVVSATAPTGTAYAFAGGLLTAGDIGMELVQSAVDGNRVSASSDTGTALAHGGAIDNIGVLTLRDALVSGNSTSARGTTGEANGGGIWNGREFPDGPPTADLTLERSAVVANRALRGGAATAAGGGIFSTFPVVLHVAVVALNAPDQCHGC